MTYIFEIATNNKTVLETRRFSVLSDGMKWAKARAEQLGMSNASFRLAGTDPDDSTPIEINEGVGA